MSRKRLISPGFFTNADLYDAEAASGLPLRIAYAGLWTVADKRGIFAWSRNLKPTIVPYDPVDVLSVLAALEKYGFVRSYRVNGKTYGWIPTFLEHQTFHRMERPSNDPAPPEEITGGLDLLNGREPSGWITRETRELVMARGGHRCSECHATEHLTMDHIVAYAKGGSNEADNLRVLCRKCNSKKGSSSLQGVRKGQQGADSPTAGPLTGTVTGTVTGTASTATTPPPVENPTEGDGPRQSWVADAVAIWAEYVSVMPYGRMGKDLAPLVKQYGPDLVLTALRAFCQWRSLRLGEEKVPGMPTFLRDFRAHVPMNRQHEMRPQAVAS